VRTGAAVVPSAAFGRIGAGLAAILLSGGYGTGAIGVSATFLGSFWHDGLLGIGIWYQNGTSFDAVTENGGAKLFRK
jgi:hypothetical protein